MNNVDCCYFVAVGVGVGGGDGVCVLPPFLFDALGLFIPCVFLEVVNLFKLEFSFFCTAGFVNRYC